EIRDHARTIPMRLPDATLPAGSTPNARPLITLHEVEDNYIQEVLTATGNNKTQAARILGIHPTSLLRRLKKDQ
ncbi:MAG TPA: helix-turn-helix domain-containing protein, partial [Terriglobales bacterium]|nr:helix-turn-helix domain-containing protein [Terriglobales bacterium]